ncbi:MAG TPA: di-heme oxidoredictase family protein [Polyangia bacterium]|nr:di-heme oxidoredictase family protein [Polyangia bacterium]
MFTAGLGGCSGPGDATPVVESESAAAYGADDTPLSGCDATVVARGIPGAGAVAQVGTFHPGSPIHDKPALAASTAPGTVLDGRRLLVASTSSFGEPLARPEEAPGAVLSLDVSQGVVDVPADFATAGGQAATPDGRVMIYTAQNAAFLNSVTSPTAVTAALPAASLPLGVSINRGFGRPWIANAPAGRDADGTITVEDPNGAPLAGAPSAIAGGVFAGDETNRDASTTKGLDSGAVATALLTKSPDGSGKAVFLAAEGDGSVVQVHVLKGVDGLVPAGTFTPLPTLTTAAAESTDPHSATRVGLAFNWVPARTVFVTDPLANRVLALDLSSDAVKFSSAAPRAITSRAFNVPVDLAPAVPEIANGNFASNTTLGGGSDLYVLNRGNNSIVRLSQAGRVLDVRRISVGDASARGFRANGIAVSEDAQTIWVTATLPNRGGVVLQMRAFGAGFVTPGLVLEARAHGATDAVSTGGDVFSHEFGVFQGLGPLFNARGCGDCHASPTAGGMGLTAETQVTRVGRLTGSTFDPLTGHGGPIARTHSIRQFGFYCGLQTGVTPLANVTSVRSAMTLRGTALIDAVLDKDVLAVQAAQDVAVRGRPNTLADGRLGRFGWKGQIATLVEFMGAAFRDEMGITNPLEPDDLVRGCGSALLSPEVDAVPLQDVAAFMSTLDPPVPATTCTTSTGAAVFKATGCASCHTPSLPGPGRTVDLFSDLMLHDMGPGLDDKFQMGTAAGNEWRTMPLWRLSERGRFLHDGRATTIDAAVAAHGGQAASSAAGFAALDADSHQALLDFLGCI